MCNRPKRFGNYRGQQQQQHQQPSPAPQNDGGSGGAPSGSHPVFRAEDEYEYDEGDVRFGVIEEQQAMTAQLQARYAPHAPVGSKVVIAWLDSGASLHTFNDESQLTDVQTVSPPTRINVADGGVVEVRKRGQLVVGLGQSSRTLTLHKVAYDSRLVNLVSVGCLIEGGFTVSFGKEEAVVRRTDSGKIAFTAEKVNKTFVLVIIDGILQQQQRKYKEQLKMEVRPSGERERCQRWSVRVHRSRAATAASYPLVRAPRSCGIIA